MQWLTACLVGQPANSAAEGYPMCGSGEAELKYERFHLFWCVLFPRPACISNSGLGIKLGWAEAEGLAEQINAS